MLRELVETIVLSLIIFLLIRQVVQNYRIESRSMEPDQARLVSEQASAMQDQVQHYLDRARIAAQQHSVLVRTDTVETLERLLRVMQRLNPDIAFALDKTEPVPELAMESQDVEEIFGNLLENAGKWAKGKVRIAISAAPSETATAGSGENRPMLLIEVEDDGPGMPEDQLSEAMKGGRRLDESKPGTGLGLSIIKEIAGEYKGSVSLSRSQLGGLCASVLLPVAIR